MNKNQSFWFLSVLVLFLSVGLSLSAQTTTPPATPDAQSQPSTAPDSTSQPASTPEQAQPNQRPSQTPDQATRPAPDSQTSAAQPTDSQSFSGTIVKAGDKYVFQDDASGKTYDIDHQTEVQKYEGKKVKVHGTLDASGKMIHIQ